MLHHKKVHFKSHELTHINRGSDLPQVDGDNGNHGENGDLVLRYVELERKAVHVNALRTRMIAL